MLYTVIWHLSMCELCALLKDMAVRGPKKQFEVLWRGAKSYGPSADVLTGNFASGVHPFSPELALASCVTHESTLLSARMSNLSSLRAVCSSNACLSCPSLVR